MAYTIEYSGLCIQGLVRKKNEDNLCCGGKYLPIIHTDDTAGFSGTFTTGTGMQFAVFDGLGGESCGEIASHLAARSFASYEGITKTEKGFAEKAGLISQEMNRQICSYAKKNRVRNMGTTVAALSFEKELVQGFNLGDSRCYRLSDGKLRKISTDHVISDSSAYDGCLTQCIGHFGGDNPLEPSLYEAACREKDIYLLCTDGLTKMISERRIAFILKERITLPDKLEKMKNIVLRKGAEDNTTIILFEILKRRKMFGSMLTNTFSWIF